VRGCVLVVAITAVVVAVAALAFAHRNDTHGPDPYNSFHVGDDQAAVLPKAKHAYGEVTDTSGNPGGLFCFVWAAPSTKLCFMNGRLFSKSR
jgi:hypothetical protein